MQNETNMDRKISPESLEIGAGGIPKAMPKTSIRIDTQNAGKIDLDLKMIKNNSRNRTESSRA